LSKKPPHPPKSPNRRGGGVPLAPLPCAGKRVLCCSVRQRGGRWFVARPPFQGVGPSKRGAAVCEQGALPAKNLLRTKHTATVRALAGGGFFA